MKIIILILMFVNPNLIFAETLNISLNIKFASGAASLDKKGREVIYDFVKMRDKFPSSHLLISGHTDSLGSNAVNQKLSEARARSVKGAFILSGIDEGFLKSKGFGEEAPIGDNATVQGRAQNRRVVVSIYALTKSDLAKAKTEFKSNEQFSLIEKENNVVSSYVSEIKKEVEPPVEKKVAIQPKVKKVQKIKKTRTNENRHRYQLALGSNFTALDASDVSGAGIRKNAEWVSEVNYNILGAYQFKIAPSFWLGLAAEYHIHDYKSEAEINYVWDEGDPNLLRLALISDYEFNDKFGLGIDIDYNEESFIYVAPPSVTLRKSALIGASLRGLYKFYNSQRFSSRIKLKLSYPVVGDDSLLEPTGGLGYMIELDGVYKKLFNQHELGLSLYYGLRSFEHNQNDQDEKVVGLNLFIRNNLWL